MEEKILTRVGDFTVTEKDVLDFINLLGQEGMQFNNSSGIKQVAKELMNQHLIYLDAKESKLDEEEDFVNELNIAKEQMLKQYSMRKVLESVEVPEEEIKAFYEENKAMFKPMYSFKASHILVEEEDKAKEIKAKLDEGSKFEDLAQEFSTCPSKEAGGELGVFSTGQMVPEFEDACVEMEIGSISEPVKTQFGYHLIKLDDKALAKDADFESVKLDINNMLLGQKQQEKYLEVTENLHEKYEVESFI